MAAAVLHDSSHHKQPCTSATCCSPSRLWRAVQTYISTDAKQDLVQLCQDENRGPHVLRVLLTSRLNNDASLYPASHKHRVIQFDASVRPKAVALFGKSATDLNALQLAIFYRRENLAIWLLKYLRPRCSSAEFKMFLHHVWGHKNTSLHLACFFGMHRLVQLLLDMGMAPSIKNARHLTPADCCMNNQECLALLQKSQAPTVVVPKRPLSTSPAVTVSAPKSPVKSTPMTRPVL
ncbi:uncharacterized protein BYT42DRAFT_500355, partial [Radiomyces spectabilis]|uniref:uncharacterized protein n=1 Tax=Radiomyces spectabilis TaxID=64574 RepID=UPI0022210F7F